MTDKDKIVEQTKAAFDFIERLYLETSYFIKQMEGLLAEEPEGFIIGRPSGYNVSTRSSTGLDTVNVRLWLRKKYSVFFVPNDKTHLERGQSITKLDPGLRVLYFRFLLHDSNVEEPMVYGGVLYHIAKKPAARWTKFEHIMNHIEYNDEKVFGNPKHIDYEDSYISFKGKLVTLNLYDINDSEAILEKLIKPSLSLYRS